MLEAIQDCSFASHTTSLLLLASSFFLLPPAHRTNQKYTHFFAFHHGWHLAAAGVLSKSSFQPSCNCMVGRTKLNCHIPLLITSLVLFGCAIPTDLFNSMHFDWDGLQKKMPAILFCTSILEIPASECWVDNASDQSLSHTCSDENADCTCTK